MIRIVGINRLNKQLIRLAPFQRKTYAALKRKENNYRNLAKAVVQRVVYSTKENPDYPRSGNLLAATDVNNIKGDDAVATYIFLNPDKASRSFGYKYKGPDGPVDPQGLLSYWTITGQGGYRFYPSYVRHGEGFMKRIGARDFVAGRKDDLAPVYTEDVATALRKL